MTLRSRLLLFFLIAAFVPFGALGLVVRTSLVDELGQDHQRRLAMRVGAAERALDVRVEEDRRAVEALCAHDLVVDRLLLELATDSFTPSREQALTTLLPSMMQGRGFDTLHLIDARGGPDRGRILGAGHYPDRAGASAAPLLDALQRAGRRSFISEVRVLDDAPHDVRALLTGCTANRDGVSVAVIAGRLAGPEFGSRLLGDVAPVEFALISPGEDADLPGSEEPTVVREFLDANGEPALVLLASIDDAPLQREIASLQRRSLYVAGAALALALLMAVLLTWTLTRPLEELESAAKRVASGDLDSQVPVHRKDEVGAALTAFNDMTRELASTRRKLLRAERIAAWREVARRIAHEIKNPLQPIQMEIETMRKLHKRGDASFDEEFESSTQMILEEVKRLNTMVTEFSRFARLPRPNPSLIDLREVAQHVAALHQDRVDLDVQSVKVSADREQLTQVLVNLIQNAADAAGARHGDGGRVRLVLSPTVEGAELRVEDDGPGISPDDRLRVFEPYFTTKAHGTGLGLAIVHRIVGDHGGSIDVEDGIDGGAAFVIQLPRTGPPEAIAASLSDTALPLGRADATVTRLD